MSVRNVGEGLAATLRDQPESEHLLRSLLRIRVVVDGSPGGQEELPDVLGRHEVFEGEVRFTPYFPFEPKVRYRATFDPGLLGHPRFSDRLTVEFSPAHERASAQAHVRRIFPSADALPENLLRFYACFSSPMQRGQAEKHIKLLGPDGRVAPDALYRAPVELWDRSMTCLTVLLDPGRLKRRVGPNRSLGPPLKFGQEYTLVIDAEMLDTFGRPLRESFFKSFRVKEPVRRPVRPERWRIRTPKAKGRGPVELLFEEPLDWGQLWHAIAIDSEDGQRIDGRITIDQAEKRWAFSPESPWDSGEYRGCIASHLEDVCGNSLSEAFDGPIQSVGEIASRVTTRFIPFRVE